MSVPDFAARATTEWLQIAPELVLTPAEMQVAVRFSRLYLLQRKRDEQSLRRFESQGVVSIDDFRLVSLLRRKGETGLTNAELVSELGGSKAGMSNRLDRLVKADVIERVGSPVDRRVHSNILTQAGQQLADDMITAVTMGRKPVFEDLTDRQISNAAETLEVMIRNLDPND